MPCPDFRSKSPLAGSVTWVLLLASVVASVRRVGQGTWAWGRGQVVSGQEAEGAAGAAVDSGPLPGSVAPGPAQLGFRRGCLAIWGGGRLEDLHPTSRGSPSPGSSKCPPRPPRGSPSVGG